MKKNETNMKENHIKAILKRLDWKYMGMIQLIFIVAIVWTYFANHTFPDQWWNIPMYTAFSSIGLLLGGLSAYFQELSFKKKQ